MLDSALEQCSSSAEFKSVLSFSAVDVVRSSHHCEQNLCQKWLQPLCLVCLGFFFYFVLFVCLNLKI